jgi:hypothetical protein
MLPSPKEPKIAVTNKFLDFITRLPFTKNSAHRHEKESTWHINFPEGHEHWLKPIPEVVGAIPRLSAPNKALSAAYSPLN